MNFTNTTVGLASDHTGVELKESIKTILTGRGLKFTDFGSYSAERCDYPDYAHPLARAIERDEIEMGIAFCGTGNGMAITLNKYPHVRAGLAWNAEIARLVSAHNKANILIIPARFIKPEDVSGILQAYLDTPFEGGQHQIRINEINNI